MLHAQVTLKLWVTWTLYWVESVFFFFVSLQLCGFPLMLYRFCKTVTDIPLGWVTRGDSLNLPIVLEMFILNVFLISTLCVRTDLWALITQKCLHLTFSQISLQAYVFPKCQVWNCHYTIHCETSIYYLEWEIGINLLIIQNGKESFSYNIFLGWAKLITHCKSFPNPQVYLNSLFWMLITRRTKQNVPLPFILW